MKIDMRWIYTAVLIIGSGIGPAIAQTDGTSRFSVKLEDYGRPRADHFAVVWVTTENDEFIKTLWKQGPMRWTSREWDQHCRVWNQARGGSEVVDGYTSATARTYDGTNSPVIVTWDCRDAENKLVPDAKYKFWIQYAENAGQGPYTTNGLLWTKSETGKVTDYTWPSGSFTNLQVVWTPAPTEEAAVKPEEAPVSEEPKPAVKTEETPATPAVSDAG
jgi:hypothetical protein